VICFSIIYKTYPHDSQTRSSSLRSSLGKLDKVSDSREFRYNFHDILIYLRTMKMSERVTIGDSFDISCQLGMRSSSGGSKTNFPGYGVCFLTAGKEEQRL